MFALDALFRDCPPVGAAARGARFARSAPAADLVSRKPDASCAPGKPERSSLKSGRGTDNITISGSGGVPGEHVELLLAKGRRRQAPLAEILLFEARGKVARAH